MPTGGGKSLCFQLPAIISKGITIVISPLISLIHDQVKALRGFGIYATFLGAGQNDLENSEILTQLTLEKPQLKILYISPEKINYNERKNQTMKALKTAYANKTLTRIVIDEAHCVSQWGHEFRPDYHKLDVFKESFPELPIIALTATATKKTYLDVMEKLKMKNVAFFTQSFNRPNLFYQILPKTNSVVEDIVRFIKKQKRFWNYLLSFKKRLRINFTNS